MNKIFRIKNPSGMIGVALAEVAAVVAVFGEGEDAKHQVQIKLKSGELSSPELVALTDAWGKAL